MDGADKITTLLKSLEDLLKNDAAILDIKYPTITALHRLPKAHKSI